MSHCVCAMVRQTTGDNCRQLQSESKLQRQCFQTAGLQMSQWQSSRSVEQEPMGLIVGHSWSAFVNSMKSPRQTQATHSLCVIHCPPDQSTHSRAATPDTLFGGFQSSDDKVIFLWQFNWDCELELCLTIHFLLINLTINFLIILKMIL